MNKNIRTILTTAALALTTGCVTAGTWVNGCYIDGPLCTVCDGMKVVVHAYGTTVCTHCDGTGIEPPETTIVNTVVMDTVICDTWCPPPPPRPWHHHRPIVRRPPPPPPRGGHHKARPVCRPVGGRAKPAARPAPRPAGGHAKPAPRGGHGGGRPGRR